MIRDSSSDGCCSRPAWPCRSMGGLAVCRSAFTLVELLVVISILALLLASFFAVGQAVITGGKERNTRAMLLLVQAAVDEFHSAAPLSQVTNFTTRYGGYPPCEMAVFTATGLKSPPLGVLPINNVTPGAFGSGAALAFNVGSPDFAAMTNGDIKAMILAIRTFSVAGSQILDRIDPRYRRTDDLADSFLAPDPSVEYLDRNGNGVRGQGDAPLKILVDDWGQPIEYLSTRVNVVTEAARQMMSDVWVRANNGQPVLMSYGANGPDQFDTEFINGVGKSDLVTDWTGEDDSEPDVLDNPLNDDNVFISDALKKQLQGDA